MDVLEASCLSYLAFMDALLMLEPGVDISKCSYSLKLDVYSRKFVSCLQGWEMIDVIIEDEIGYQGIVFFHKDRNIVGVSHRGTVVDTTLISSLNMDCNISILSKVDKDLARINKRVGDLIRFFCLKCVPRFEKAISTRGINGKVYHVGHSLGGFLAELASSLNPDGYCITFDSLGTDDPCIRQLIPPCCSYFECSGGTCNRHHYSIEPNISNTAIDVNGKRYVIGDSYLCYDDALCNSKRYGGDDLHDFYGFKSHHPMEAFIDCLLSEEHGSWTINDVKCWPKGRNIVVLTEDINFYMSLLKFIDKIKDTPAQERVYEVEYFDHSRHGSLIIKDPIEDD